MACALQASATWRRLHPDESRAIAVKYRKANRELARQRAAEYRRKHPAKTRASVRNWKSSNQARNAAHRAKGRVIRRYGIERIPEEFDFEATIPFYAEAQRRTRETAVRHVVDHIIALFLGGLHEASNLQVLTEEANLIKERVDKRRLPR